MARTQVESPRLMMHRLTGFNAQGNGISPGHNTPSTAEFATRPLPGDVPAELRAAQACARLLHNWVEDVRAALPACRMPRNTAQHHVAEALEMGKSTLNKTIRGDRWMTFAEVVQLLAAQPRTFTCLAPDSARHGAAPRPRADASTALRWRDRHAGTEA